MGKFLSATALLVLLNASSIFAESCGNFVKEDDESTCKAMKQALASHAYVPVKPYSADLH